MFFFIGIYLLQNFVINSLDWVLFKRKNTGYYHDDQFLRSFSFKVYQALIGLLFSALFGQSFHPTVKALTVAPELLKALFNLTMPASVLLLLNFLFELTSEEPDVRSLIYRSELAKVYFSVIYWYVLAMIFSNWLQSLRKFIVKVSKTQEKLRAGQKPQYQTVNGRAKLSQSKKD